MRIVFTAVAFDIASGFNGGLISISQCTWTESRVAKQFVASSIFFSKLFTFWITMYLWMRMTEEEDLKCFPNIN